MRRWRLAGVVALAAAALLSGFSGTVLPTRSAWTDQTVYQATAAASSAWVPVDPAPAPKNPVGQVVTPGNANTVLTALDWRMSNDTNLGFCVDITTTGASDQPEPWKLAVNLDLPPFNGVAASSVWSPGSPNIRLATDPDRPRVLLLTGTSDGRPNWDAGSNNALLTSSRTLVPRICVSVAPPPPLGEAGWYQVDVERGTWNHSQACLVTTITGRVEDLAANPFYYGWEYTLDLSEAKAHFSDAVGGRIDWLSWSPHPGSWAFTAEPDGDITNEVADRYHLTSGRATALRGTNAVTVTTCVRGHVP